MAAPGLLRWGAVVVPWTAAWTSEASRDRAFIRTERFEGIPLRFLCEGVDTLGVGKPLFKMLHNDRCRDVLHRRVCQICRTPLPAAPICVNQGEREGIYPLINDGLPMCAPCAALALAQCPGLQAAEAAGRLRIWEASAWRHAPVLRATVPRARGGNPHVNDLLLREFGPVFSGMKLVLTKFRQIQSVDLISEAPELRRMKDNG
jgi:hypothetical protein